jgi:hypothetical protein
LCTILYGCSDDDLTRFYSSKGWDCIFEDNFNLFLLKILSGGEYELASSSIVAMSSNETRLIKHQYDNGTISFTIKNSSGVLLGSVTADDPSPHPGGLAGFIGEVDISDNEYLCVNDFKIEKHK